MIFAWVGGSPKNNWETKFLDHKKSVYLIFLLIKATHRKKAPSNEALAPTKSMNIDTWVVVTSNELFIRGS